ncbi:unnamed protein product [Danaus chrysippus]|uniref:(African queen) hypothetical protein n=1 Tax=Danaus chrysippus TaxID=151541 RepID=A0A8J2W169_9NEOP|nr:unnamed protein product [Danaus chrysippus]
MGLSLNDTIISNSGEQMECDIQSQKSCELNKYRSLIITNHAEGMSLKSSENITADRSGSSGDRWDPAERGSGGGKDASLRSPAPTEANPSVDVNALNNIQSANTLSFAEVMNSDGEWKLVQRRKHNTKMYRYLGVLKLRLRIFYYFWCNELCRKLSIQHQTIHELKHQHQCWHPSSW